MASARLEFKRGDDNEVYFQYPIDAWESGGQLAFTAKQYPDNDNSDAKAVINKVYGDPDIIDGSHPLYDPAFATYRCTLNPSDTNGIQFPERQSSASFDGEFQYTAPNGEIESFPKDDDYWEVVVYADIRRSP